MTKAEVLQKCTVVDNVVKLPNEQLDRKVYLETKKALEGIGGKWKGGKVAGFVFPSSPSELLAEVAGGKKINLKKDYQYFATPAELADKLVSLAEIELGETFLEPSAGQGAIVKAINRVSPSCIVDCYELMPTNQPILKELDTVHFLGTNFLDSSPSNKYDRIIANPPFTKDADIIHVQAMYERLNEGGRMVSIVSNSWTFGERKKCKDFRNWLVEVDASVISIPMGSFKESGTLVGGKIIIINK